MPTADGTARLGFDLISLAVALAFSGRMIGRGLSGALAKAASLAPGRAWAARHGAQGTRPMAAAWPWPLRKSGPG